MSQWWVSRSSSASWRRRIRSAFTEGEIGSDDDRGALVETADEVEQKLAAGLSKEQMAEFIENDEVHAGQVISEPTLRPFRVSVSSGDDIEPQAWLADR